MNNSDWYFIVSIEYHDEIQHFLNDRKILFQNMSVNYGFHSSLIENVKQEYIEFTEKYDNIVPDIQLISKLGKKVIDERSTYLWDIIRGPMKFNPIAITEITLLINSFYPKIEEQ